MTLSSVFSIPKCLHFIVYYTLFKQICRCQRRFFFSFLFFFFFLLFYNARYHMYTFFLCVTSCFISMARIGKICNNKSLNRNSRRKIQRHICRSHIPPLKNFLHQICFSFIQSHTKVCIRSFVSVYVSSYLFESGKNKKIRHSIFFSLYFALSFFQYLFVYIFSKWKKYVRTSQKTSFAL